MSKNTPFDPIEELKTLPQFSMIDPKNIEPWVNRVQEIDNGRLPWHVRRLSGIGGSEIGVLIGEMRGYFHPHSSARKLVRAKLLIDLPEPPNGHMMRGQQMEDMARDIYRQQILETYPLAKPRDDIIQALGSFRDPVHPWIIGTPDEVMELEPGKIWIIDYKCPTQNALDEYATSGVPFYYSAQLHHYKYIAEKMGYPIAGLQLASLDYGKWRMDVRFVPQDEALAGDCIVAGQYYWNEMVLKGKVPPLGTAKKFGNATDVPENVLQSAINYATYRNLANHFSRQADTIAENLRSTQMALKPSEDTMTVGIVDLKAKRELDYPAMVRTLEDMEVDPATFKVPGEFDIVAVVKELASLKGIPEDQISKSPYLNQFRGAEKLDEKAIFEMYRKMGLDLEPHIITEQVSLALGRGKNHYTETMITSIKSYLAKEAPQIADKLLDAMAELEDNYHKTQIEVEEARRKPGPKK